VQKWPTVTDIALETGDGSAGGYQRTTVGSRARRHEVAGILQYGQGHQSHTALIIASPHHGIRRTGGACDRV